MRTPSRKLCPVFLLVLTAAAPAQDKAKAEPAPKKSQLEQWLEQASASHPDVKVAEAKLREALAELERARATVMQKVVGLHHAIESQKLAVEKAELDLTRLESLKASAVVPQEQVDAARRDLIAAKARMAELQDQMKHLTTNPTQARINFLRTVQDVNVVGEVVLMDVRPHDLIAKLPTKPVQGPVADRIRKALDRRVTLNVEGSDLRGVLEVVRSNAPGLLIQVRGLSADRGLTARVEDLPLGAVLQWLEDAVGGRFVVREYGLLLAPADEPLPGAQPLAEFWKADKKDDSKK